MTTSAIPVLTVHTSLTQGGRSPRWRRRKEETVSPPSERWNSASHRPSTRRRK